MCDQVAAVHLAEGEDSRRHSELTAECQAFRGTLAAKVLICRPADPEAKGLVGGCTTTWSGHSCLAETSARQRISTPSCTRFWPEPTPVTTAGWDADRPIESTPTGQR